MNRTTIVLPQDLKRRAVKAAKASGMPFSQLVRQALSEMLKNTKPSDPFLNDQEVYVDAGPHDTAAAHDQYIY